MSNEEKILKAFAEARKKGRTEISSEAIFLLSDDVPKQSVFRHLNTLEKYGIVKKTRRKKKNEFWKLTNGR